MSISVVIPVRVVTFKKEQLERWVRGERDDCPDAYAKNPLRVGSTCFGEFIVGQYFAEQGYQWIHHDFSLITGNLIGKYPKAEEIFRAVMGDEGFLSAKELAGRFGRLWEPDLMLYKPDLSEVRFVECKRVDTRDKLCAAEVKGLVALSLLGFDAEVCQVVEEGREFTPSDIVYEFAGGEPVAVRQLLGQGIRMMEPHEQGSSNKASKSKEPGPRSSRGRWDKATFLEDMGRRAGSDLVPVAEDLIRWAEATGLEYRWGGWTA